MAFPTLDQRNQKRLADRDRVVRDLEAVLADYARRQGGRFLLYGSTVRGCARPDSDLDLILDFDLEKETAAWNFAETLVAERGLRADILPKAWCAPEFLARIVAEGRVLG